MFCALIDIQNKTEIKRKTVGTRRKIKCNKNKEGKHVHDFT